MTFTVDFDPLGGDLATLCQTPPDVAHGVPCGVGDWRFVVEILLPEPPPLAVLLDEDGAVISTEDGEPIEVDGYGVGEAPLWDVAVWDGSVWGELGWFDLTADVRGTEWGNGGDVAWGRPRVGVLGLTVDSDGDKWSPWNPDPPQGSPAYFAPGSFIRAGLRSATDPRCDGWIPFVTTTVESWPPSYVAAGFERFVDISAIETLSMLAEIDSNALDFAVGSGDDVVERLARLLEAAGWRFGLIDRVHVDLGDPGVLAHASFPATDMADNRIAECYRTGDSVDVQVATDGSGAVEARNRYDQSAATVPLQRLAEFSVEPSGPGVLFLHPSSGAAVGSVMRVVYDAESFQSANDVREIRNDIRYARVGGSQQVFEHVVSIGRFGRKTAERTDLLADDTITALLAERVGTRQGSTSLRVEAVTVDVHRQLALGGVDAALAVLALRPGDPVRCDAPGEDALPFVRGFCRSTTHRVIPLNSGELAWWVTVAVDAAQVGNLPGASIEVVSDEEEGS